MIGHLVQVQPQAGTRAGHLACPFAINILAGAAEVWQAFTNEATAPAFVPIDGKDREATLHKFWSLMFYTLVGVCCITQTVLESKAAEDASGKDSWRRVGETVIYRSNAPTKVAVMANSVLVPVTLAYQGYQVDVQLLLDTGASGTVINTEIADRLNINLSTARKARGRVVGGIVIDTYQITLSRLTVGPHAKDDLPVSVIPHKGPPAKYDGLLGMDVLRGLKYVVDFEKHLIVWE